MLSQIMWFVETILLVTKWSNFHLVDNKTKEANGNLLGSC